MHGTSSLGRVRILDARRALIRALVRGIAGLAAYGVILFLPAGRLGWPWGWVLLGVLAIVTLAEPVLLFACQPALLVERGRGYWNEGVKRWDKRITAAAGGLMLLTWLVAALNILFAWMLLPLPVHLGGLVVTVLGCALFLWAMTSNAYFSGGVLASSTSAGTPW
jgi:hypothetical protein